MKRTKLRFLFTPIWIINIYIQFGLLYTVLPKTDGQLSLRWLSIISLLFMFCLILIRDVFIFRRLIFLKIIGFSLSFFSLVYVVLIFLKLDLSSLIYLGLLLPTLFSSIYILKSTR